MGEELTREMRGGLGYPIERAEPMTPNHALLALHGIAPLCGGGPESTQLVPIPTEFTCKQNVRFWGYDYEIEPAVCSARMGDGLQLFALQPLNTRPNYYLARIDSSWGRGDDDIHDHLDEIIDAIADDFSEIEREREYLIEDGVAPEDADLDGHESELGWPVMSLDSGYSWWTEGWLTPGGEEPPIAKATNLEGA